MQSVWYPAPAHLANSVAGIWSVHASRDADLRARVLPDGTSCLVFQRSSTDLLCSHGDHWTRWQTNYVSGPRTGAFDIRLAPGGSLFIVQLQPHGVMPALHVPSSLLADRFEPLDAVINAIPTSLRDCILSDASDQMCVRAIGQWLVDQVEAASSPCAITDEVVREVNRTAGNVRIEELAKHVNLSRRHLGRIIQERVGITPKLFARVTRFHRAVQLSRTRPALPFSRIAAAASYADQAHMTREFVELGGIRPSDFRGDQAAMLW